MFQRKADEVFKDLYNVFGIIDYILALGYDRDDKDHHDTLQRVLQRCRQVNLKLNKDKYHVRCTQVLLFGEVISRNSVKPDPRKLKEMTEVPLQKNKRAFLGIINYLTKFSPSTADACETLKELTSVKTEWTWNAAYQKLFHRVNPIIKADTCMKFYDETKPLYLETDTSGVGLGASLLLQTTNGTSCPRHTAPYSNILQPITFASKSLSSAEKRYSNIER